MATGIYDDQDQKTDHEQSYYNREFDNITQHYNDEVTPRDLKKAEESSTSNSGKQATENVSGKAGDTETRSRVKSALGTAEKLGLYKPDTDNQPKRSLTQKRNKAKKVLMISGIGGSAFILIAIFIFLFMFLSQFKNVHFAEVLRSVGMARFNYTMKQNYTRSIVDAAVLSDDSNGSLSKLASGADASIPKQLVELGKTGQLKWIVDRGGVVSQIRGKQTFGGFEIGGQRYALDDYAQAAFKKPFKKLNAKQQAQVFETFLEAVDTPLANVLNAGGRWFRYKIYGSLRDLASIKLYKWVNRGQEYQGKSPEAARKLNVDETVASVDDANPPPKTGVKAVDDEAQNAKAEAVQAAETGVANAGQVRTKWGNVLRTTTKVSLAVFLTTAACIIHSLANSFAQTTPQTEKQSLRLGQDALASAAQTEEGATVAEAVGADSSRYVDAEKSVMYKQATGETTLTADDQQQLSDIPDIQGPAGEFKTIITDVDGLITSAVVGGPLVNDLLSALGAGGFSKTLTTDGCNILLNKYVQLSLAGGELLVSVVSAGATEGVIAGIKAAITGGLEAAGSIGLGDLLGTLLDKAVGTAAGLDYSGAQTGPALYNQETVGVQEFQSDGNRTISYGVPVDKATAAAQQKVAMASVYAENSQLPFSQRYFAISNPYSLTGKLIAYAPSSLSGLAGMVRSGLGSVAAVFSTPQRMFGAIGNIIMPQRFASAEQLSNVNTVDAGGVQSWETTQAEQAMQNDSSTGYDFKSLKTYFDGNPNQLSQDTNDFGPCYAQGLQDSIPDKCTNGYLTSPEARRFRFYEKDLIYFDMSTGDLQ
ncbi:MAG: hypothetical protein ACQR33_03830 [Candidatus Saccharibacteria bacterium]